LVAYFARLTVEDTLEILKNLLRLNIRANLQIVVQICTKYSEQVGPEKIIELFETFKSYEGMFFYLAGVVNTSEDKIVHNKYIEAAAKIGQFQAVQTMVKESKHYDPEKIRDFLKVNYSQNLCIFVSEFNEFTPSKLLGNNIKVKEKFCVLFVHSSLFSQVHVSVSLTCNI
jgi:hypothetical protein